MLAGYALAIVVGIPLAVGIVFSRAMEETVYPVVVFLQIVPKIAVAPLFIIWFGFGFTPKAAAGVPAVVLSDRDRVDRRVPRDRSGNHGLRAHHRRGRAARLHQGAAALRPAGDLHRPEGGAAISATAAVVAEFVASDRGLGYLLLQYNGDLNTQMVFAIVIVLGAIGLLVYFAVELLERLVIPWHASQNDRATASWAHLK